MIFWDFWVARSKLKRGLHITSYITLNMADLHREGGRCKNDDKSGGVGIRMIMHRVKDPLKQNISVFPFYVFLLLPDHILTLVSKIFHS